MSDKEIQAQPAMLYAVNMTMHTASGDIEAEPVVIHASQVAEGVGYMDSVTGRVSGVALRVVDVEDGSPHG